MGTSAVAMVLFALAQTPTPVLVHPSPAAWPGDAGGGGEVALLLTVDERGAVADVEVSGSPGEPFTSAALTAARGLVFEPVLSDGGAVGVVLAYRYTFARAEDAGVAPKPGRLSGVVSTKGSRDVVTLAQLRLEDGGVTLAETDTSGRFSVELPAGDARIEVTAPGHLKRVFPEKVTAGQQVEVRYRLEPTFGRPYETVVRGQADRAELSRSTLSGAELHEAAGTGGQPLRVVMLLPGVVTPASGLSYPVVRGAVPAATGFFLDGVRMPQLYHLLAASSVVHPDFIERIDFFPANAPARYGRISGGVIGAHVAKARDDRVHLSVAADLLQANAFVEVPITSTGTNITAAGSVNYAGWLLSALSAANAFNGTSPVLESYDYQARVEQKVGRGSVRLLAFGSSDLAGVRSAPGTYTPTLLAASRFHRVDLAAQLPVGPGVLEVGSWVGWETMGLRYSQVDTGGEFNLQRFLWTGRVTYRVELGEHVQLKAGFDAERTL